MAEEQVPSDAKFSGMDVSPPPTPKGKAFINLVFEGKKGRGKRYEEWDVTVNLPHDHPAQIHLQRFIKSIMKPTTEKKVRKW